MTKKALLKRIKSLEEFLNVVYVPGDLKDDYDEHVAEDYGIIRDVMKLTDKKKNKII